MVTLVDDARKADDSASRYCFYMQYTDYIKQLTPTWTQQPQQQHVSLQVHPPSNQVLHVWKGQW